MKTHVMLDLETLGTTPGSVILSIGAVKFDRHKVYEEFIINVSPQSCIDVGLTMEWSTVLWWLGQSEEARKGVTDRVWFPIKDALQMFSEYVRSSAPSDIELWGNGANFDNVLLAAAYDACGLPRPWKHHQDRCYRTFKAIHPEIKMQRTGTHHDALDDARSQAEHLISLPTFQAMCDREENLTVAPEWNKPFES